MKVKALQAGFYGGQRYRTGTTFQVAEGAKASWFAPVQALGPAAPDTPVKDDGKAKGGKGKGKEPETLSEMARSGGKTKTLNEVLAKKPEDDGDIA